MSQFMSSRSATSIDWQQHFTSLADAIERLQQGAETTLSSFAGEQSDFIRFNAGKVRQIISGSIGLDDWEWGVDLFADDPVIFKKLIYEMRFDEVSAVYAMFGQFYVGRRIPAIDRMQTSTCEAASTSTRSKG